MITTVKTRVQHKHDTAANWENSEIVPLAGEIIIYDVDDSCSIPRVKIGDGINLAKDLPFAMGISTLESQIATLLEMQAQLQTKVNELSAALEWGKF